MRKIITDSLSLDRKPSTQWLLFPWSFKLHANVSVSTRLVDANGQILLVSGNSQEPLRDNREPSKVPRKGVVFQV